MEEKRLIDDCFLHDKDRLRHHEALEILRSNLACVVGVEEVSLGHGLGRILRESVTARHPVPLHRNAAVDGYAFRHSDLRNSPLPVSQRIAAGDIGAPALKAGTAARVFTGAAMPHGADSVAMQEDCTEENDIVVLPTGLKAGANCRQAGEDLAQGDIAVASGTRLQPVHLAALASVGRARIRVSKPLRVTLLSSGNELRIPGDGLGELLHGQVWDANAPMLRGMLDRMPIEIIQQSIVSDTVIAVRDAMEQAAQCSDLVISTGGASRGQEDHMLSTLDELGKRHLWQLAIKPGRPMMFGQIERSDGGQCLYLGLPGNPVAALVCFLLYAREMILRLCGAAPRDVVGFYVPAGFSITDKKPDRREFLRGILRTSDDGIATVTKFDRDGSGLISSLTQADGLIEIPEQVTQINLGDPVRFLPFSSFD